MNVWNLNPEQSKAFAEHLASDPPPAAALVEAARRTRKRPLSPGSMVKVPAPVGTRWPDHDDGDNGGSV